MPLSLPNITCPLTHFLNKILRLRADMEQIGRTSESEVFTSIFAQKVAMGHHLFVQAPTRFHAPHSGGTCTGRSMAITRVKIRGLGALEAWARARQEPPTLIRFLKEPSLSGGLHATQYQKGSRVSSYTRPSEGKSVAQIVSSGVNTRRERGFLSVRPTSSPYAQRTP